MGGLRPLPRPRPRPSQKVRASPCNEDTDCQNLSGCIRCAHSGFCADQPLQFLGSPDQPLRQAESAIAGRGSSKMDCGPNVQLCGILVLESGFGSGVYHHKEPVVHGLWPQTGQYGTSKCIAPKNDADPDQVFGCYKQSDSSAKASKRSMWFEKHEWRKHGKCAGVQSASDFFTQVCALSSEPLNVLAKAKHEGQTFHGMADALRDDGFPVYSLDEHYDQIQLSACAGSVGRWILAATSDFADKCGGSGPGP